ncbi:MAG: deoxyribose-phosphate aldolase [Anaerolineae bacterium]|nr:deoxyribose-phosphate aldolase [Anaerolineae bacterium]
MSEGTLTHQQIAKMIDISAVQAYHGERDIRELVGYAREYGFGAVHVLPSWIPFARTLLQDVPGISLGSPVGFPSGGNHTAIKRAEAIQMVSDGVTELDMMINVGKLRSGDYTYVLEELRSVIASVNVPAKVIIETHFLTDDEIRRACELCVEAGAQFVKTSTGWAPAGATLTNIALIADCVKDRIGIKASGGIRDLDMLVKMYLYGVRRFGINLQSAVEIVRAVQRLPDGVVRIES